MKVTDIALAVDSKASHKIIGIRPGEKLHEQMIGAEDAPYTYEYDDHFKVLPNIYNWSKDPARINNGKLVNPNFTYASDNNKDWMSIDTIKEWLKNIKTI
jgi:hypothetical protein